MFSGSPFGGGYFGGSPGGTTVVDPPEPPEPPADPIIIVAAPTADDYFDGRVPIRSETWRFDVYNPAGFFLGYLAVDMTRPPTIVNDTSQQTRRSIQGLWVLPRPLVDRSVARIYADDLEPASMRIQVFHIIEHITGQIATPYGEYVWGLDSETVSSADQARPAMLFDRSYDLAQALDTNVGYPVGTNIADALIEQATAAGITDLRIEATTRTTTAPVAGVAGRDTRLTVMEGLCAMGGYLAPYFANDRALVCRAAPNLGATQPDFEYGPGTTMYAGSIARSKRPFAPNRYVAIDTAATDSPVVGVYDIPAENPNSYEVTGRRRIRTVEGQGFADLAAANDAARAAYVEDNVTHLWLSFETPPDPRHDTWNIIREDGIRYFQQATRLPCVAGGAMVHECYA